MNIGSKIRRIRKNKGLTQIEVANKAQIAVNSLRNYESNKRQPNMEQIRAIATALDVSLSDLFWTVDGPARKPLHVIATLQGTYIFDPLDQISNSLAKLNDEGQRKAVERVEELTEIPKYKKEPPQD